MKKLCKNTIEDNTEYRIQDPVYRSLCAERIPANPR